MLTKVRPLLKPPTLPSEEKTRRAGILHVILLTLLTAAVIIILTTPFTGNARPALAMSLGAFAQLVAFWLLRRSRVTLASLLVFSTLLLIQSYLLVTGLGIHDLAIILSPIIIILASLLFDIRIFTAAVVVHLLLLACITLGEIEGWYRPPISGVTSWVDMVTLSVVVVVTAVAMRLLTQNLTQSLTRARRSEAQWRALVHHVPDLILTVQRNGIIDFTNQPATNAYAPAIGKEIFEYLHPEDHVGIRQALNQAWETGLPTSYEARGLDAQNNYRWFSIRVGPVRQEQKTTSLTLIATDTTARRQIELALASERDYAQRIIDNMGQGLTLTNAAGEFLFVNPAYMRMTGYSSAELLGKTPYDLTWPEDHPRLREEKTGRQQGKTSVYEVRLRHAAGHPIDVLITAVPRWENQEIVGTIAVITDLTARKQAEAEREALIAELEARNAELERFTYTVSHDLKSPLITIKGFLGFLQRDVGSGNQEGITKDLTRIYDATRTMESLLNDLLELSRIGRVVNPPEAVSMNEIVQEALDNVSGYMPEMAVVIDVAPELPIVYVDRLRIIEVMQNLLENALKFMGDQPQPTIRIGATRQQGKVVFFVQDNGIGIEEKYQHKVFGLFERLNTSIEGTGIGLALVKRIIEVHDGRIWIESLGQGQGTTFYFTLPLAKR